MSKIEEAIVKELLKWYPYLEANGCSLLSLKFIASKIHQLFEPQPEIPIEQTIARPATNAPQPDSSRLLSEEVLVDLMNEECPDNIARLVIRVRNLQDAKTASIKEAKCQARVEREMLLAKAKLTLLVSECQACKSINELRVLLDSWVVANDLEPEKAVRFNSIEEVLDYFKKQGGIEDGI